MGNIKTENLKVESKTDSLVIITSGDNKVVIETFPLKVDFYQNNLLSVSLNAKGLMRIEHLRPKPSK